MHEEQERGLFRKKPVVISAVQYTAAVRDAYLFEKVPLPAGVSIPSTYLHPGRREVYSANAYIETLEGRMEVSLDDWVITGVKVEHYPCKPDIFAATYEPASLAKPQPVGGALKKIIDELRWYNPAADAYNGKYIHKGWAERIEAALATLSAPVAQPGEAEPVAWRYLRKAAPGEGWRYSSHPLADEYGDYQIEALYPRLAAPAQAAAVPEAVGSDLIRAAMEKADFTYQPTAFAQALIDEICARIKAADDKAAEGDYMLDSDDCISVIRGTWGQGEVSGEGEGS